MDWMQIASNVGVPAAVLFYLLYRFETRLETAINSLSRNVRALAILMARMQGTTVEDVEHEYGLNGKEA